MSLLGAYFTDAFWFALVHLLLFFVVIWQLREFQAWQPSRTAADWQQLESRSQFVRGLIGLFLLVGIAGTFYALWGFATAVQGAKNNDERFFDALAQAMAKAFPVGIVGLFLTLVFSLVADGLERAKTKGMTLPRGPASIEEALQRGLGQVGNVIDSGIASLEQSLTLRLGSIEEALAPVRNLQQTLSGSLEPIIRELGLRLEQATHLLQVQGDRLEAGKTALVDAAVELASSARTISETISQLSQTTKDIRQSYQSARRLAEETIALHEQSRESLGVLARESNTLFQRSADQFEQIAKALAVADERLQSLPDKLRSDLTTALLAVVTQISSQVATALISVSEDANERLAATFNVISYDLDQHRVRVERAASGLDDLHANLKNIQQEVAGGLHSALQELAREFTRAVGERAREAIEPLDRVATEAEGIHGALKSLPVAVEGLRHEVELATANVRSQQEGLRDTVVRAREGIERTLRDAKRVPPKAGPRWWPFFRR